MIRGVRGAVQATKNTREAIVEATERLMKTLIDSNSIQAELVSSAFFTVTSDLDAAFPAEVRKKIGWNLVPFLCAQEIAVTNALPRIIRVLLLLETERSQEEIVHVYLGAAASLRPDLNASTWNSK